jgi:hypothetical protein
LKKGDLEMQKNHTRVKAADLAMRSGDAIGSDGPSARDGRPGQQFEFKIFTSIPPRVNLEQQRRVIESWRANGFTPVSVNSRSEADQIAALGLAVEIEIVSTSGKPLIGEILSVAQRSGSAFAGIVNADCRMMHYPQLAQSLRAGLNGRLFYSRRFETVDDLPTFIEVSHGFDGFFFDVSVSEGVKDSHFRMGECWWDYWFPLRLAANGAEVARLPQPLLLHEQHAANWSQSEWQNCAEVFWQDLRNWHDAISLPRTVASRIGRRRLGAESGPIAMELYRWLRDKQSDATPKLLPPEYNELERFLVVDKLVVDHHDFAEIDEKIRSYLEQRNALIHGTRSNGRQSARYNAGFARTLLRGGRKLLAEPRSLLPRIRSAVGLLRGGGARSLIAHILRFGQL